MYLNLAYSMGNVAIVSAITGAVPLISIIGGKLFFREKLNKFQYIGIAFMGLGIIALAVLKN